MDPQTGMAWLRSVMADAATLAECRRLWRIRSDLASEFTSPEQRQCAAERLTELLEG